MLWGVQEEEVRRSGKVPMIQSRWKVFESAWGRGCVCGGAWTLITG